MQVFFVDKLRSMQQFSMPFVLNAQYGHGFLVYVHFCECIPGKYVLLESYDFPCLVGRFVFVLLAYKVKCCIFGTVSTE